MKRYEVKPNYTRYSDTAYAGIWDNQTNDWVDGYAQCAIDRRVREVCKAMNDLDDLEKLDVMTS